MRQGSDGSDRYLPERILCLARHSVVLLVLPPGTGGILDDLNLSYIECLVTGLAPSSARPRSTPSPNCRCDA